jgi:hypothetical protein
VTFPLPQFGTFAQGAHVHHFPKLREHERLRHFVHH